MKAKILLIISLFVLNFAYADEIIQEKNIYLKSAQKLRSADTKIVQFDRSHYVDRLSFEAKRCPFSTKEAKISMSVNGINYQEFKVSKLGWRTFIVKFGNLSRELELKALFDKGCVKIKNLKVLPRRVHLGNSDWDHCENVTDIYAEILNLKVNFEYLKQYIPDLDNALPISERFGFDAP